MTVAEHQIEFQGRKAQRSDSRERRRAILEAALRIIVRDGIRGVRHRAVAKEAEVPLAATTYYFKDINVLITDAFNLYAEDSLLKVQKLEQSSFDFLKQFTPEQLADEQTRINLADALSAFILEHIQSQIDDRDNRVLEHTFRNEALRNEKLAVNAQIPQQEVLNTIIEFFTLLQSSDPEADAHIINATIVHLELMALSMTDQPESNLRQRTVTRMVRQSLNLPVN